MELAVKRESKKIVHFVRDVSGTGGGNIVLNISRVMQENQVADILLVSDHISQDDQRLISNVKVIPFGKLLFHWKAKNKLTRTFRHFLQILNFHLMTFFISLNYKRKGYLVVNNNNESFLGHVVTIHNVFSAEVLGHPKGLKRGILRLLNPVMFFRVIKEQLYTRFKRTGVIVANSNQTKLDFMKYVNSNIPVSVIPSGVDTIKYNIKEKQNNNFNLLFVGHEFGRKGLRQVIEAISLLPDGINLKVIGGRGNNIEEYKLLTKKLGLENRINFYGTQVDLAEFYNSSDIFILPSNYEGLPLVCLESMACGLPNLLTDVGGMSDLIKEGINGYFIRPNANDIKEKVLKLQYELSTNESALTLMSSTRESVLKYSWNNISQMYEEAFAVVDKKLC